MKKSELRQLIKEELDARFKPVIVDKNFCEEFTSYFDRLGINQKFADNEFVFQNKVSYDNDKITIQFYKKPRK
tara:strand:+ start:127 stop:345 length:219 start_codon:yes stop_codon:yes gene_type:complete